jgi:hypothetical protein
MPQRRRPHQVVRMQWRKMSPLGLGHAEVPQHSLLQPLRCMQPFQLC